MVMTGTQTAAEKSQVDDRAMGKPRGWLNWLSLGMLGAGGTEDSSQFAGVISDDVVKVFVFVFSFSVADNILTSAFISRTYMRLPNSTLWLHLLSVRLMKKGSVFVPSKLTFIRSQQPC